MPGPTGRPDEIRAVPVRHPGRWVATVVILLFAASLIRSVATNEHIEWHVVGQFLFDHRVLEGVVVTLELTAVAMAVGVVLGVALAITRLSPNPLVSGASWVYIWFFRGTPVLVQLLFWYNLASLYHHITLGIPFTHVVFVSASANQLITAFTAAILGLGLNEGAYMAEIVRAGILSVGEGQIEAAQSLGMTRLQTLRLIVLPQAMRVIIPPTGNETISMLKTSSLAATITVVDLLGAVELIYAVNFLTIPLLVVASLWYLIVTSLLTAGQYYVERYFARGALRQLPPTPFQRIRALFTRNLTTFHVRPEAPSGLGGEHR